MTINTICVCGGGTMGSGIAQVSAHAGFNTILYEVNETVLANAKTSIEKNLNALVEKGKISQSEKEKTFVNGFSSLAMFKTASRIYS